MLFFISGGGRSGKSDYAERLARSLSTDPAARLYLATSVPFDEEMRDRVRRHREKRGQEFFTLEEPVELARSLRNCLVQRSQQGHPVQVVLVECLSTWLGNLFYLEEQGKYGAAQEGRAEDSEAVFPPVQDFLSWLVQNGGNLHIVVVTNEVGLGLVPDNAMGRLFRDRLGRLNKQIAALADKAVFMVSGLPMALKGDLPCL